MIKREQGETTNFSFRIIHIIFRSSNLILPFVIVVVVIITTAIMYCCCRKSVKKDEQRRPES